MFADVLIIRTCLSVAFLFLLLLNLLGQAGGAIPLDGIVWSIVLGALHLRVVFQLLRDETPSAPVLENPDAEALWSYMHRRTGMHRADFLRLYELGSWVTFDEHEMIADTNQSRSSLFILVEGRVSLSFQYESGQSGSKFLLSGDCFDYRVFNAMGVFVGFPNKSFEVTAVSTGVGFRIPVLGLMSLMERSPQMQDYMRTYALGVMARSVQAVDLHPMQAYFSFDSYGIPESEDWRMHGARSRDFELLREEEQIQVQEGKRWFHLEGLRSFMQWMWASFALSVPPGCRHRSNPLSGSLAQARVKALTTTGLADLRTAVEYEFELADTGSGQAAAALTRRPQ
jgi:CRP-like cAMP-binding protein